MIKWSSRWRFCKPNFDPKNTWRSAQLSQLNVSAWVFCRFVGDRGWNPPRGTAADRIWCCQRASVKICGRQMGGTTKTWTENWHQFYATSRGFCHHAFPLLLFQISSICRSKFTSSHMRVRSWWEPPLRCWTARNTSYAPICQMPRRDVNSLLCCFNGRSCLGLAKVVWFKNLWLDSKHLWGVIVETWNILNYYLYDIKCEFGMAKYT